MLFLDNDDIQTNFASFKHTKIYLHLINVVEGLEGLVQGKPLWIYKNLIIIILYAWMMQKEIEYHHYQVIKTS